MSLSSPPVTVHDPIDFVCGDNWEISGSLQDASGNPLSLTGATIQWKLDSIDGATNFLTLAIGSGISITDLPSATIFVNATSAQTAALASGNYRDWLSVKLADGSVLTEWTGVIRAAPLPA
jgi:hypothetical protein